MKKFIITFTLLHFYTFTLFASDCLQFKIYPEVKITNAEWIRDVTQPDHPMDALHGIVAASFDEGYDLGVSTQPVGDGYCVVLNTLDAAVGYTNFLVYIDASFSPGSCRYNMTLEHEDEHISAYLSALRDESENMKRSIQAAANSIMPAFVKSLDGVNAALDKMQNDLQSHPDIILMKQKINAEQEIRNKKIDERDDGKRINMCK